MRKLWLILFFTLPVVGMLGCGDSATGFNPAGEVGGSSRSTRFGSTDLTPFVRTTEVSPGGLTLHLTPHPDWMGEMVEFIQSEGHAEDSFTHQGRSVEGARAREFRLNLSATDHSAELHLEFEGSNPGFVSDRILQQNATVGQSSSASGYLDPGMGVSTVTYQTTGLSLTDGTKGGVVSFQHLLLEKNQPNQTWLDQIQSGSVTPTTISVDPTSSLSDAILGAAVPTHIGDIDTSDPEQFKVGTLEIRYEGLTFEETSVPRAERLDGEPSFQAPGLSGLFMVDENYQLAYQVREENIRFTFSLSNNLDGWMGIAFHEFLFPADWIIVWWDSTTQQTIAWDAYNPGIPTLEFFPAPNPDNNPLFVEPGSAPTDNQDNISSVTGTQIGGVITIGLERPLVTEDIFDIQLQDNEAYKILLMYNGQETFAPEYDAPQPFNPSDPKMVFDLEL